MKDHFQMFAAYNAWANQKLLDTAEQLTDEQYRKDMGAFFGSLHNTMNHLIVGDQIWMCRLTGEGPTYADLSICPFDTFADVKQERVNEDNRIIRYIDDLTEDKIEQEFTFTTIVNPKQMQQKRKLAITHLFNHQTHHRGQMHATITALGVNAPALDLIFYLRETEK